MAEFSISRTEFAQRAGVSTTEISRFANGRRIPRADRFIGLVNALPHEAQIYCLNQVFKLKSSTKTLNPPMPEPPSPLASFICCWQHYEGINQLALELAIQQRTNLRISRLKEIQSGDTATDIELSYIGAVVMNSEGTPYTLDEWFAIQRGDYNPYQNRDTNSHVKCPN